MHMSQLMHMSQVLRERLFIRYLMAEMQLLVTKPCLVFNDNKAAIAVIKNDGASDAVKHVEIKKQFIRDKVADNFFKILYCSTVDM